MIEGGSIGELQKKGDRLLDMVDHERRSGTLLSGFVPSMIFPGDERRRRNLAAWKKFWNTSRVTAVVKTIKTASLDLGFTEDAFEPFYKMFDLNYNFPERLTIPDKFFRCDSSALNSK